jgi:RNA 2',3'-cyclic 3'-phosphodiesterase
MSIPVGDEQVRLFVALDLAEPVREALSEVTRRFQKICPEARWLPLAGAHVTLKFIGEVSAEKAESIREALRGVHQHLPPGPIEMRFAGVGFFPNARRPKVLWAGVSGMESSTDRPATTGASASGAAATGAADAMNARKAGALTLRLLAAAIESALEPWGIVRETREFRPHITLARFNSVKGLDSLRDAAGQLANHEFGSATAGEFHLYRSVLKSTGAEYTRLDTYPLLVNRAEKRSLA